MTKNMSNSTEGFLDAAGGVVYVFDSAGYYLTHKGKEYPFISPLNAPNNSHSIVDLFSIFFGFDLKVKQVIEYVELVKGEFFDIHFIPGEVESRIFLINQTNKQHKHQKIQQIANESLIHSNQLEKENEAQKNFISMMSHELKSPICSILGYCDFFDDDSGNDAKISTKVRKNAQHLLSLIDNLLEKSRLDHGNINISHEPVKVSDLLQLVYDMMLPAAQTKGLGFSFSMKHSSELILSIDQLHVNQVLVNLIGNAIKYTNYGAVSIESRYDDSILSIDVIDTGVGIPQHEIKKVTQLFQRSSLTQDEKGVGIGLSLSIDLIKLMGGEITISSKEGEGTIVSMRLPAKVSAFKSYSSASRVILIEDDEDISLIMQLYLEQIGNIEHLIICPDKDMNIERICADIDEFSPDVIISDYHLSADKTAVDLFQVLNNTSDNKARKFMMSASNDERYKRIAAEYGCDGFIPKPVTKEALSSLIEGS